MNYFKNIVLAIFRPKEISNPEQKEKIRVEVIDGIRKEYETALNFRMGFLEKKHHTERSLLPNRYERPYLALPLIDYPPITSVHGPNDTVKVRNFEVKKLSVSLAQFSDLHAPDLQNLVARHLAVHLIDNGFVGSDLGCIPGYAVFHFNYIDDE